MGEASSRQASSSAGIPMEECEVIETPWLKQVRGVVAHAAQVVGRPTPSRLHNGACLKRQIKRLRHDA